MEKEPVYDYIEIEPTRRFFIVKVNGFFAIRIFFNKKLTKYPPIEISSISEIKYGEAVKIDEQAYRWGRTRIQGKIEGFYRIGIKN